MQSSVVVKRSCGVDQDGRMKVCSHTVRCLLRPNLSSYCTIGLLWFWWPVFLGHLVSVAFPFTPPWCYIALFGLVLYDYLHFLLLFCVERSKLTPVLNHHSKSSNIIINIILKCLKRQTKIPPCKKLESLCGLFVSQLQARLSMFNV